MNEHLGRPNRLADYGFSGLAELSLDRLHTLVAGTSIISGAPTDAFLNAAGNVYDYGQDNAFSGLDVAVLHLYTGENFDFVAPTVSDFFILHYCHNP